MSGGLTSAIVKLAAAVCAYPKLLVSAVINAVNNAAAVPTNSAVVINTFALNAKLPPDTSYCGSPKAPFLKVSVNKPGGAWYVVIVKGARGALSTASG